MKGEEGPADDTHGHTLLINLCLRVAFFRQNLNCTKGHGGGGKDVEYVDHSPETAELNGETHVFGWHVGVLLLLGLDLFVDSLFWVSLLSLDISLIEGVIDIVLVTAHIFFVC